MDRWTWSDLLIFVGLVCGASLVFHVAGSVSPQIILTIPRNGISIGSNTVLIFAASFVPALVLLVRSAECRSVVVRFTTSIKVYLAALLIGFVLPFVSYIGAQHSYPLWDSETGLALIRVFLINLFLSPLFEEIIWRGYFYPKVSSMLKMPHALFVAALGFTLWHIGFVFYLYHAGIAISVLSILVIEFFLMGIIQCSIFTLAGHSLAPCVLLHTAFNASTTIYYGKYDRIADVGSYIAETLAMLVVAGILFRTVIRRGNPRREPLTADN
jgi:membrane protease YdiL (CAAX protease family)